MGFLWEIFQESQIFDAAADATEARLLAGERNATAQMLIANVQAMEQRLRRLEHCTDAIWSLLKERVKLADDDLVRRLREIAATATAPATERRNCIKCGAKLVPQMDHCQICGEHVTT
jgi:hypothetical protein